MVYRLIVVLFFSSMVGVCVQAAKVTGHVDVGIEALLKKADKEVDIDNKVVRELFGVIYQKSMNKPVGGNKETRAEDKWPSIKSWVVENKNRVWNKALGVALHHKKEAVPVLVAAGMDVNEVVSEGRTFLMWAAIDDNKEVVETLLANGASVDRLGGNKRTALMYAAIQNSLQVVQLLLANGADKTARDEDDDTVLMYAASSHKIETVQWLLSIGVNIHEKNGLGMTALMIAARLGNIGAMQELLKLGANKEEEGPHGTTLLGYAVYSGKWDAVQVLLDAGVNINMQNRLGNTVLIHAALVGQFDMVNALQAAGADINMLNFENETVLDFVIKKTRGVNFKMVRQLRLYGAKTFAELSGAGGQEDASAALQRSLEMISLAPDAPPRVANLAATKPLASSAVNQATQHSAVPITPLAIPHSSFWSSLSSPGVIASLGVATLLAAALYVWHYYPSNTVKELA